MEMLPLVPRGLYESDYCFYRTILSRIRGGPEHITSIEDGFGIGSKNDFNQSLKQSEDRLRRVRVRARKRRLDRRR